MTVATSKNSELGGLLTGAGLDTVDGVFAYEGGQDLSKPGLGTRRRTRIELTDPDGETHVLYLKRYGPERIGDRWRRFITYGRSSPASVEFENIRAAQRCGVATMDAITFGHEMGFAGFSARRSYLVVTSVPGDAIERCGEEFLAAHASDDGARQLTGELARLVAALHVAGFVHRDLYASHVFLHDSPDGVSLCLIDLARMFAPRWRAFRWFVKDLAQLKYSMPAAWVQNHWDEFLRTYLDSCGGSAERYSRAIDHKAASIRRQAQRRAARHEKGAPER